MRLLWFDLGVVPSFLTLLVLLSVDCHTTTADSLANGTHIPDHFVSDLASFISEHEESSNLSNVRRDQTGEMTSLSFVWTEIVPPNYHGQKDHTINLTALFGGCDGIVGNTQFGTYTTLDGLHTETNATAAFILADLKEAKKRTRSTRLLKFQVGRTLVSRTQEVLKKLDDQLDDKAICRNRTYENQVLANSGQTLSGVSDTSNVPLHNELRRLLWLDALSQREVIKDLVAFLVSSTVAGFLAGGISYAIMQQDQPFVQRKNGSDTAIPNPMYNPSSQAKAAGVTTFLATLFASFIGKYRDTVNTAVSLPGILLWLFILGIGNFVSDQYQTLTGASPTATTLSLPASTSTSTSSTSSISASATNKAPQIPMTCVLEEDVISEASSGFMTTASFSTELDMLADQNPGDVEMGIAEFGGSSCDSRLTALNLAVLGNGS